MIPTRGALFGPAGLPRVLGLLRDDSAAAQAALFSAADRVRRAHVGDALLPRGLVEISNHCRRQCAYCGIRASRRGLPRYRMTHDEVARCAAAIRELGLDTIVLQSGEDPALDLPGVAALVRRIKAETGLAVTLSLGERSDDEWRAWRAAGADRVLLKFETSDDLLYERIHPPGPLGPISRIDMLRRLKSWGYEVGSGVMVGIPGQSWESLARDIHLFAQLALDMVAVGPFVPHPDTPLGQLAVAANDAGVPPTEDVTGRVLALARLACPSANIPATTALEALCPGRGRADALSRGANVWMHNLTPSPWRSMYDVYPGKGLVPPTAASQAPESFARCAPRR